MAYVMPLAPRRCRDCKKAAHLEVFNRFNDSVGFFCRRDGSRMMRQLEEGEKVPNDGRVMPAEPTPNEE